MNTWLTVPIPAELGILGFQSLGVGLVVACHPDRWVHWIPTDTYRDTYRDTHRNSIELGVNHR